MELVYAIEISKDSEIPIYQQLAEGISALIENNLLSPDMQLPPIRKLAGHFGVNSVTVVAAYKCLREKNLVYSKGGSGTYVSPLKIGELSANIYAGTIREQSANFNVKDAINFASSATSSELFPTAQFKALFNAVLDRDGGSAFDFQESRGYPMLRQSLCNYLTGFNIQSHPDRIQIISGAQQGIDIIARSMLNPGDVVFVEKPTYLGAVGAFLSRGATVIEIPVEKDGMDMDTLESFMKIYRPKFIYAMPYFQTPTCLCYSHQKKRLLLELASQYDAYILEDDSQSEFVFSGEKAVVLKSLDYKNRVIYLKSFSKVLSPGLRLGFMVLPKKISQSVLNAKYTADIATPGIIQRAFDLFLRNGGYDSYIESITNVYKKRYEAADNAVGAYLKNLVGYTPPQGGLSMWLKLPKGMDSEVFAEKLVQERVIIAPGSMFLASGEKSRCIRLNFAGVSTAYIGLGIKKIAVGVKNYGEGNYA